VLLVSHDRALLDAVPDRIVAFEDGILRSYDGGWADVERERSAAETADEPAPDPPKTAKPVRPRPTKSAPSELQRLEAEIEAAEVRVAELEKTLSDDWTNMDVLTAHRAARDELTALLARWEVLFEDAHAT
jgi:ATPase subunit of ABC transporter with duplicated ATPase domains